MGFFSSCEHKWERYDKKVGILWMEREEEYHKCTKCHNH